MAVADPMLQRNLPLPAMLPGGDAGERESEFAFPGRHHPDRIGADTGLVAPLAQTAPAMVKGVAANRPAEIAERMKIAVADLVPMAEFDAELDGRHGLAHEVALVVA